MDLAKAALVSAAILSGIVAAPAAGQTTIGTDGISLATGATIFDQEFIGDNRRGQVFQAVGTSLDLFSVWLIGLNGTSGFFTASLFNWNPTTNATTGSAGYSSGPVGVTGLSLSLEISDAVRVVLTPGVAVIPGQHYLMFFDAATVDPGIVYAPNHAYPEGSGALLPKGSDLALSSFEVYDADLAFAATFRTGVVPEPGTWLLLGTGLMGLGVIARRRRWKGEPRA